MAETKTGLLPKEKGKKGIVAPTKKTMNFVHHEKSFNVKKLLPIILIIIVAAAAFLKFGILDQTNKKILKYAELSSKQEQLAQVNATLSKNKELTDDYGRYSYGWLSPEEIAIVDRMEILKLIDQKVMAWASVKNFAINDNVLTMNLSGISLERASAIVKDLETSDLVQSAAVYNVTTTEGDEAVINMGVILTKEVPEE